MFTSYVILSWPSLLSVAPSHPPCFCPQMPWRKRTISYSSLLLSKTWYIVDTQKVFASSEWVNKWREWMSLFLKREAIPVFLVPIFKRKSSAQFEWTHEWMKCFKAGIVFTDSTWPLICWFFCLELSSPDAFRSQLTYALSGKLSLTALSKIDYPHLHHYISLFFLVLFSVCNYLISLWSASPATT